MEIRDVRNGEWHWVYNSLLSDPHLFPNDKLVYSAISTFGGHQVIHPTIDQIGVRCGVSKRGVQMSLSKLEEVGYIRVEKSTGRGHANVYFLLKKSKGCNSCVLSKERNESQEKAQPSAVKSATIAPHKDIYKYNKNINATQSVAVSKDEKIPIPNAESFFKDGREKWDGVAMSTPEFVLMCRASKWSHIRLIGEYADERKPEFSTRGQWKEFGKRNMRPARRLSPYTEKQLDMAISRMNKDLKANGGFISKWSLETLEKYLD